jgi:hypothetical protein
MYPFSDVCIYIDEMLSGIKQHFIIGTIPIWKMGMMVWKESNLTKNIVLIDTKNPSNLLGFFSLEFFNNR